MILDELYRLLRTSHVQAQGIVDTLQEPLVVLDKSLSVINANPAFYRTFNTERDDTLGRSLFELGNGQWDISELRKLLGEVVPKAAAIIGYEVSHDFPDLGTRTMLVSARRLAHPDNNSTQVLVVFEDVTERRKAQVAQDILLAETRHRMKNLMAIVRSVARQTSAEELTGKQYRDSFLGRLEAILAAQELISANGAFTDLATLVNDALRPVAQGRAAITPGPSVRLTQHRVLPVSMILHELATNALKYGALSRPEGRVDIGWKVELGEEQARLMLDWRETGGPAVSPPTRRGFGTEMIDYSCKSEGGAAKFHFEPAGLRVNITLPLED